MKLRFTDEFGYSFVATPQQFTERFGLSVEDIDLECEWAAKYNELVDIPAQPGFTVQPIKQGEK